MASILPLPTTEEILAEYDFDYETSEFRYPQTRDWQSWGGRRAGNGWADDPETVGFKSSGYITLRVKGRNYVYHRLVWKMFTGCDPVGVIDHINGDRQDNRIENLRDVSLADNSRNNHGRGYWSRMAEQRKAEFAATLAKRRRDAARQRRAEIEAKERAELARLVRKYGCQCGRWSTPKIEEITKEDAK